MPQELNFMGAILLGSLASGGKVLRKSQRSTEVDGLVTLVETYTIRTQDIATIEPDRNTTHASFSSASVKYPRMLVETTRIDQMDGGLSTLNVTYVGLDYASGLPPAYVTSVGRKGAGVFGADAAIVARYLTEETLNDTLVGGPINLNFGATQLSIPTQRFMPGSINGTAMPSNPFQRQYRRSKTSAERSAELQAEFYKIYGPGSAIMVSVISLHEWIYAGYVQSGISFQRRGLFNQVEEEFTEFFQGTSVFYSSNGLIDKQKVLIFQDVIQYF